MQRLLQLRHKLHANPRVSNNEAETAAWLQEFMGAHSLQPSMSNVGEADGDVNIPSCVRRLLALRWARDDIYRNRYQATAVTGAGFHHACGHDGHSTMLAGALLDLHNRRDTFYGTVIGLFQPAEETGDGAKQMIAGGIPRPSRGSYGLHNIPGKPLGHILIKEEGVAARASGVASHASEPDNGVNPAFVLASLLHSGTLTDLPSTLLSNGTIKRQIMDGPVLATPVHMCVGKDNDFGILPADAVINMTLRADNTRDIEILRDHVEHLVATEAAAGNCKLVQVDVVEPFPATINDARRSRIVVNAAAAVGGTSSSAGAVGGLDVTKMETPFPWSEDFGWFGESYKEEGAVLFGIGSGEECPPLHSKTYDFPDALLPIGVELWSNIARKALA
eukprot:gene1109-33502_t